MSIPFYQIRDDHCCNDYATAALARPCYVFSQPCKLCGYAVGVRMRGMVIEWTIEEGSRGSDIVGDFTWPGAFTPIIVTDRVKHFLNCRGYKQFEFTQIEMYQSDKLKRPARITGRTRRRVWLPYEGPELSEWFVTGQALLDFARSKRGLESDCPKCSRQRIVGDHTAPMIVNKRDWDGSEFFCLSNFGQDRMYYVTESAKTALEAQGFSNIRFLKPAGFID